MACATRPGLPSYCFGYDVEDHHLVVFRRGEHGFFTSDELEQDRYDIAYSDLFVRDANRSIGVTPAQAAAMYYGATLSWDVPEADPASYTEDGKLKPEFANDTW